MLTTRAACEAFVVIDVAHCLARIAGTNDLLSTAQTLPCTNTVTINYLRISGNIVVGDFTLHINKLLI